MQCRLILYTKPLFAGERKVSSQQEYAKIRESVDMICTSQIAVCKFDAVLYVAVIFIFNKSGQGF